MNQRHLWTIVTLFLTVLGIPSVGRTQTSKETAVVSPTTPATDVEVVKVGEYQSPSGKKTGDAVITQIHPHIIRGRQAATLFIRNIPVLTFVSSSPVSSLEQKIGDRGDYKGVQKYALIHRNSKKMGSFGNVASSVNNDPIQRASLVAAKIKQLVDDGMDANQITVSWKAGGNTTAPNLGQNLGDGLRPTAGERYIIKIKDQELVEINENTRLAGPTPDLSQDALQATNRLRRLIGKASPLNEIAEFPKRWPLSIPKLPQQIAIRGMRINFTGMASWYGYDGSASSTASGERYNPEGLTAAHRSLPMGTRVLVTNIYNGRSVVVRINDRGPYIGGRIIDLSAGAARVLDMMGSGVAPVKIDILGR